MENKIYNDDVERIVNAAQAEKRDVKMARAERRKIKMAKRSATLAIVGLTFAVTGIIGWVEAWLAFVLFFCFVISSVFFFGRFFEGCKLRGWH